MDIYGELLRYALSLTSREFDWFGYSVSYLGMFYFLCVLELLGIFVYWLIWGR